MVFGTFGRGLGGVLCAALVVGAMSRECVATPPTVVEVTPDNGDLGVDPALTELRIRFDQDMGDGGHSLCRMGSAGGVPSINGKLTWVDSRTVIVPVKLEPATTYALSVNCASAGNFRSTKGESAVPYMIAFRTRALGESAPAALDPAVARESIADLRKAIDQRYSYRDLRQVDWDATFAEYSERLEKAATPSAFAREAARLLARAGDLHITVKVGELTLATASRRVPYNFDLKRIQTLVPKLTERTANLRTGTFDDGIGYMLFTECSNRFATGAGAAKALDEWSTPGPCRGVIVDARTNSGGDELVAREVATLFTPVMKTYSRHRHRAPAQPDGWTTTYDRLINPPFEGRKPFPGKVAVLIGKGNMSSAESFILMMRHGAGARLFGEKTYGSSGNPQPVELPCGVTVLLPSWQDMLPDGTVIEGVGIEPDVKIAWPTGESKQDPVLEAALEWIRE